MDDYYYRDTQTALEATREEDWDFLHEDLQQVLNTFMEEVEWLLDEYEIKSQRLEKLEDLLDEEKGE